MLRGEPELPEGPVASKYTHLLELPRTPLGATFVSVRRSTKGHHPLVEYTRLDRALVDDPELLEAAVDGARLEVRLNHPNVVQAFEVGRDDGHVYVVREYLDGLSLEALFERGGRAIATGVYLRVLCGALEGLHYAHEARDEGGRPLHVVHLDLSPRQVVVTCDGWAKVLGFGSASVLDHLIHPVSADLRSRLEAMSPEQVRSALGPRGRRVDIFAAGALLFRALTGRSLWQGQSEIEILQALAAGRIPSVRTTAPHVSAELAAICDRALAPNPAARYPTALALREAIEGHLARSGDKTTREQVGLVVSEFAADQRAKVREALHAYLCAQTEADGEGPDRRGVDDAPPVSYAEPPGHPYRGNMRAPAAPTEPSGYPYRSNMRVPAAPTELPSQPAPSPRENTWVWENVAFVLAAVLITAAWLAR